MAAPNDDAVTLTREELYDQVWSEPMWTLAARFGLSDVGLAKTCRRLRIPVPGRGYWQQKQAGQKVRPTKLPQLSASIAASIQAVTFRSVAARRAVRALQDKSAADLGQDPPLIVVPDILTDPHSLIAHTITRLRRVKPTREGLLPQTQSADYLDVRVTLDTVDRAMCILDALIKALEERGIAVRVDVKDQTAITQAQVLGELIPFHIEERVDNVPIGPVIPKRPGDWAPRPETKPVATGALSFYIDAEWYLAGATIRKSWRDGKLQRVEECVGAIVLGLIAAAHAVKADRLAREERDREWKESERRRRYADWQHRQEQRRVAALKQELDSWRLLLELQSYVQMRRSHGEPPDADKSEWESWLGWIEQYAEDMEASLTRQAGPEPEPFDETRYY